MRSQFFHAQQPRGHRRTTSPPTPTSTPICATVKAMPRSANPTAVQLGADQDERQPHDRLAASVFDSVRASSISWMPFQRRRSMNSSIITSKATPSEFASAKPATLP